MFDEADDLDFISRHFPPEMDLTRRTTIVRKSRLILEASVLEGTGRYADAVLLFEQAGELECRLADSASADSRPSKIDHIVSAASCFARAGDIQKALDLVTGLNLGDDAQRFFEEKRALKAKGEGLALQIGDTFVNADVARLEALVQQAWGLVPPRFALWPSVRFAASAEARTLALKRLIIAYPWDLGFNLLYLSSNPGPSPSDATRYAEALVRAFPERFEARTALALAHLRSVEYQLATEAATIALRLAPPVTVTSPSQLRSTLGIAHAICGMSLRRIQRTDEALDVLRRGVALLPDDPELRGLYALTLYATGDERTAEAEALASARFVDAESSPRRHHRSHWSHTIAGELALRRGDWNLAIDLLKGAIERATDGRFKAKLLNDLGVACAEAGHKDYAAQYFEAALSIDPHLAIVQRNLSALSNDTPRVPAATTLSEQEIEFAMFGTYTSDGAMAQQLAYAA